MCTCEILLALEKQSRIAEQLLIVCVEIWLKWGEIASKECLNSTFQSRAVIRRRLRAVRKKSWKMPHEALIMALRS